MNINRWQHSRRVGQGYERDRVLRAMVGLFQKAPPLKHDDRSLFACPHRLLYCRGRDRVN